MLRVQIEVRHYPITKCGRICFDDRRLKKVIASLEQIDGVSATLKPIGETVPRRVEEARARLKRIKKGKGLDQGGDGVGTHAKTLDWRPQDCGKGVVELWYAPRDKPDSAVQLYEIASQREFLPDGSGVRHDECIAAVKYHIEQLQEQMEGSLPV